MKEARAILWVDDDLYVVAGALELLQDKGYEVVTAKSVSEAKDVLLARTDILHAVLDVMLPPGDDPNPNQFESKGGFEGGIVLGRWIRADRPDVRFIGCSGKSGGDAKRWFEENAAGFIGKPFVVRTLLRHLEYRLGLGQPHWRIFIVHGHDDEAKLQLKNFIQNTLDLGEPIVLHEMASKGRAVIEKFEEEAADIDLVFAILTPDDVVLHQQTHAQGSSRARQNVIFELGYFFAKLRRGRVILLYKGELEIPSDIAGLIYIRIDEGVQAAGELIRREVKAALSI